MSGDTAPVVAADCYQLRNVASGLLLEVYGSAKGGAPVQQGPETGSASQHWQLSPVHEGARSTTWSMSTAGSAWTSPTPRPRTAP